MLLIFTNILIFKTHYLLRSWKILTNNPLPENVILSPTIGVMPNEISITIVRFFK